jgi:hypothetical protein
VYRVGQQPIKMVAQRLQVLNTHKRAFGLEEIRVGELRDKRGHQLAESLDALPTANEGNLQTTAPGWLICLHLDMLDAIGGNITVISTCFVGRLSTSR